MIFGSTANAHAKRVHAVYPNVSGVLTTAGGLVFTA